MSLKNQKKYYEALGLSFAHSAKLAGMRALFEEAVMTANLAPSPENYRRADEAATAYAAALKEHAHTVTTYAPACDLLAHNAKDERRRGDGK